MKSRKFLASRRKKCYDILGEVRERMESTRMRNAAGACTGCNLGAVTPLCMPWREENHLLRPVFSHDAASLSLELAATAYDLETAAWRESGWYDFSYLIDNELMTGPDVNGETSEGTYSPALFERHRRAAAALIKKQNPISLLRGTLRQREESDTCKCLVMMHRTGTGLFVVALGFMGTGKRIYDWFSNFRNEREEGVHQGFLQLTREFENRCAQISFPQTARELGLPRLTLSDVFSECRRPSSRFRIWMAGHSQGGAVMQLAALRLIRRGILRQHLIGYGFASPSVAYENPGCDLSSVPLFHIVNSDDVTPRIGAYLHAGRCMFFHPDARIRALFYGSAWDQPAFRDVLRLLCSVHGSREGLALAVAFLQAVEQLNDQEAAAVISRMVGGLMPEKMITLLSSRADQFIRYLTRHAETAYKRSTAGEAAPESLLRHDRSRIAALILAYGPQPFARALLSALSGPHRLQGESRATGGKAPYQTIVNQYFGCLSSHPHSGSVPMTPGQPLRAARAPVASRYRQYSRRRNQRTAR